MQFHFRPRILFLRDRAGRLPCPNCSEVVSAALRANYSLPPYKRIAFVSEEHNDPRIELMEKMYPAGDLGFPSLLIDKLAYKAHFGSWFMLGLIEQLVEGLRED